MEPHYEQHELEKLWTQAFPFGLEFDQNDFRFDYDWNFSNLGDAFKEGGVLHGQKVYLFCETEPQLVFFNGESRVSYIPVVVAIVSSFPPSDKLGTQTETEQIVDMMEMNMSWVPYIPLGERERGVERINPQIFILSFGHIEADLQPYHFDNIEHCIPYFKNPFNEIEQSTIVDITYPTEARPVVCDFDWRLDELEEFTNELIEYGELSRDHADAFRNFVEQRVLEQQNANREAMEQHIQAQDELRAQGRAAAFEQMKFYKFYPVATRDTPDVTHLKSTFINRYYGHAHQVL